MKIYCDAPWDCGCTIWDYGRVDDALCDGCLYYKNVEKSNFEFIKENLTAQSLAKICVAKLASKFQEVYVSSLTDGIHICRESCVGENEEWLKANMMESTND